MPTVADTISIAKVCEYLIANDNAKRKAFQKGGINTCNPILVYSVRKLLENVYNRSNNYTGLQPIANYLYWLCDRYKEKAKAILLLNNTGYNASTTAALAASVRAFRIELLAGAQISIGATSYTINYTNIVDQSVHVETPQSNVPEGETNQFSYSIIYSKIKAVINFTNDDGSGNNLGVPDGMLLIITGLYISATDTSTGETTIAPKERQITGADLDGSNQYINSDFIGYDVIVNMRGIGDLTSDEITVLPVVGGFQLLLSGTFTSDDKFTIRPNGLL